MDPKNSSRSAFAYLTIGIQLAITVLIFVFGGYKLDLHYNKSPIFVAAGAFIGMGLGFYHLLKQLHQIEKKEKEKKDTNHKRIRWM